VNSRSELSDPKLGKFLQTRAPGRDGCARWDRAYRRRSYPRHLLSVRAKGQNSSCVALSFRLGWLCVSVAYTYGRSPGPPHEHPPFHERPKLEFRRNAIAMPGPESSTATRMPFVRLCSVLIDNSRAPSSTWRIPASHRAAQDAKSRTPTDTTRGCGTNCGTKKIRPDQLREISE
jgi:hypothetical protein